MRLCAYRVEENFKVLILEFRLQLKEKLQLLTVAIGGVGLVSAYFSYTPEIAARYVHPVRFCFVFLSRMIDLKFLLLFTLVYIYYFVLSYMTSKINLQLDFESDFCFWFKVSM